MSVKKIITVSVVSVLVVIVSIVLLATSIHKVETNHIGVFYDKVTREIGPVHTQGLYNYHPFSRVVTFSAVYEPIDIHVGCVTSDGLNVTLSTSFQYVPEPAAIVSIMKRFQDASHFLAIVTIAATSAVHQTCSEFQISDYQNSRPIIQSRLSDNLGVFLKSVNASALAAQLTNVAVPTVWNEAVFAKQRSESDISLANNQRSQILYLAQNNVSLADQDATITIQNAKSVVRIIEINAQQQALAIQAQYDKFTTVCQSLIKTLKISPMGLVTLLRNRVIGGVQGQIDANL